MTYLANLAHVGHGQKECGKVFAAFGGERDYRFYYLPCLIIMKPAFSGAGKMF